MYCIYCGKELPDEARFCMACGKAVAKCDSNTHTLPNDWRERVVFTYSFSVNGEGCTKGVLDGKCGILKTKLYPYPDYESQFISPLYEDLEIPKNSNYLNNGDLYSVKKNGKWGVIKIPNEEVLPCVYDEIIIYCEDYFLKRDFLVYFIKRNGKWGVNKYPNEEVLPCIYDDVKIAYSYDDKLYYHLKLNEKWSVYEAVATKLKSFVFDDIEIWSSYNGQEDVDTEYKVRIKDKYGLYSYPDNEILPCQYDAINGIEGDGFYKVMLNGKYGIVDEHNNEVVPIIFEDIINSKVFSDGHFLDGEYPWFFEKEKDKCYVVAKKCNKLGVYECCKGLVTVPLDLYVDINIDYVPFIIVSKNNKKGLWRDNQEVLICEYDDICANYYTQRIGVSAAEDKVVYFIITKNRKFGLYDYENHFFVPSVCDNIDCSCYPRFLTVKHKGKNLDFINKGDIMCDTLISSDLQLQSNETGLGDIISKKNRCYLFFDTETTGVPKNYKAPITDLDNWPRLVQLGWILTDEYGNEIDTGNDIIRPEGFVIPEAASNVHKITTEIAISKGKSLSMVLKKFISACKQVKFLVGHNVSFDINVVGAELLRSNSNYSIASITSIDTMLKSVNYCAIPSNYSYGDKYKWPKLQELHKKLFGYEFEDAHDAMADIRATKKCFFELQRIGIITEGSTAIKQRSSLLFDDGLPFDLPF